MQKRPARKKRTQAELAAELGVSRRTIANWKADGIDLDDIEALRLRAASIKSRAEANEDLAAAKLRKLRAEADRQETAAARERGELVEASGIRRQGEAIGRAMQAELARLEGNLPGMLAGRKAAEIARVLKAEFRAALTNLQHLPHAPPI